MPPTYICMCIWCVCHVLCRQGYIAKSPCVCVCMYVCAPARAFMHARVPSTANEHMAQLIASLHTRETASIHVQTRHTPGTACLAYTCHVYLSHVSRMSVSCTVFQNPTLLCSRHASMALACSAYAYVQQNIVDRGVGGGG